LKSAITISLVPQLRGGPFVFHDGLVDGCERAAALGFDGVEIFPPSASAIEVAELKTLLGRLRLGVSAVGTGPAWVLHKLSLTDPDAAVRARAREFIRDIISLAAELGAPAIIGSTQGQCREAAARPQALAWLGEALVELAGHAAARGQSLLYEPLNRYETNLFNRVGDAAGFLDTLPAGNLRILADLFHLNIEEDSVPGALRALGPRLGHVHFADSNRRAMGFGHTEVPPIIQALREIGYAGYLSAEVLPLPDSDTAARQTIKSFRKYVN
jgi:sugar phosphate isomerase/epimerase